MKQKGYFFFTTLTTGKPTLVYLGLVLIGTSKKKRGFWVSAKILCLFVEKRCSYATSMILILSLIFQLSQ